MTFLALRNMAMQFMGNLQWWAGDVDMSPDISAFYIFL